MSFVAGIPVVWKNLTNILCTIVAAPCPAGNILYCNLTLANTGNVRLTDITAGGHAITCALRYPTLLSPGASFVCTLSRFILQDDFELGNVDLAFPIGALALGQVSALIDPQPSVVYNVKLPQRPVLELVTSLSTGFVTWPGDLVLYSVELINRGNVHLKAVDLHLVTNSSTNGMNTSFPMDCGAAGALPRQILVEDSFTCTRAIEFTTPVRLLLSALSCLDLGWCGVSASSITSSVW